MQIGIEIDDKLLSSIFACGNDHYPNEFGGFLIGYYSKSGKTLIITDYIVPINYESTPTSFIRSTEGIEFKFKEFYQQNPKNIMLENGILILMVQHYIVKLI